MSKTSLVWIIISLVIMVLALAIDNHQMANIITDKNAEIHALHMHLNVAKMALEYISN